MPRPTLPAVLGLSLLLGACGSKDDPAARPSGKTDYWSLIAPLATGSGPGPCMEEHTLSASYDGAGRLTHVQARHRQERRPGCALPD